VGLRWEDNGREQLASSSISTSSSSCEFAAMTCMQFSPTNGPAACDWIMMPALHRRSSRRGKHRMVTEGFEWASRGEDSNA